ncbi:hydroxymethylbilane synthase [Desulfobaculum bizertense]|uniref:Porphobilinogen deaminase n=1 Tax=Desulfobaculum bizertense DSM 18034 TaxID=1121442 RepID=A0A1T4X0Y8_9BACT|nr:hydroxymethylbilane synthase [Desulfobaculum bizertense]SKA83254.1 hydroxymethylbilane synthase [Desulfobaculum bizertense DSM 18034]
MKKITIATRGSKLALWQANHIKDCLQAQYEGLDVELLIIKTTGDKILDVPLAKVGGKGLFVKEIEEAMLNGRADLAVHSMKDVPVELPEGLVVGVNPTREDNTDSLLSVEYGSVDELPEGAKIGTSSLRRRAQLLALRPDLNVLDLRGNVDTRLRKLMEGQYDAIVMATAGVKRLGLSAPKVSPLAPPTFIPAVAQGALGIEYAEDGPMAEFLEFLNCRNSRVTVQAERGFLTGLNGGCQVPIGSHAVLDGDTVALTGCVWNVEGTITIRKEISGPADKAFQLGLDLAQQVLDAGAKEILDELYCDA